MKTEGFALRMIVVDGFNATALVDKQYARFENKEMFPFALTIELSFVDSIAGRPSWNESERLEEIIMNIVNIVQHTQEEVHYIGRVNREGAQDVFYYIASDELDGEAIGAYCDSIEEDRDIAINIFDDPNWEIVSGLLD